MKATLVLLAFFGQFNATPPMGPATAPNPNYPLRVHILIAKANGSQGVYQGFGRGDIVGAPTQGIDYTFSCGEAFLTNAQPTEFYQARWKKPNEKLELLLQPVGSNNNARCELKVALKTRPYGHYDAAATTPPSSPIPSPAVQP